MLYALNSNVYLVKGSAKSCIYDLNSLKLYSVNNELAVQIDKVNNGNIQVSSTDKELHEIFDEFIRLGIFTLTEKPIRHQIDEIKIMDIGCVFAWIEISNKCNLTCRHCYNRSDSHYDTKMTLHDYKIVVDSLIKLGVSKVQIIGGEPFFDSQILKEMLDYTVGKFDFIEIFTNGMLVTQDWFEYLAENNIHVALSVYSYKAEMHDKVTGHIGSWMITNKTIQKLKKSGIAYRVCNVLMKDIEIGEKDTDLYELSDRKDVIRMSGRADFSLLTDELIKKRLITKKTFQEPLNKTLCRSLVTGNNCFKNKIYISANMEVFPCVMERRLNHSVISEDVGIVLDDSIRDFNKDKVNECCCCEYRYVCFDCRPNTLTGDLKEKPWYCTYNPMLGEWKNEDEFITKLKKQWGN